MVLAGTAADRASHCTSMRGCWLRLGSLVIGSVVLGCTPASTPTTTPTPLVTPPPVPADVKPWPDIAWMPARGVGGAGPADAEQVVAVAAVVDGFVAVGYRENGPIRDGLIWHSPDGEAWTEVGAPGAFDAVDLVDVAPAPGGFVALGMGPWVPLRSVRSPSSIDRPMAALGRVSVRSRARPTRTQPP